METWQQFIERYAQTVGIAAIFAFLGAGLLLWTSKETHTLSRALLVVVAGECLMLGATAIGHGYLQWTIFVAPIVGLVCGLVALPVLVGVAKLGERLGTKVPDMGEKLVDKYLPEKDAK